MEVIGRITYIVIFGILLTLTSATSAETNVANHAKRSIDPDARQGFFLIPQTAQQQAFFPQQQQGETIFRTSSPAISTFSWLQILRQILFFRYIRKLTATTEAPETTTPLPSQFSSWYTASNNCRYQYFDDLTTGIEARVSCENLGARLMVEGARGIDSASTTLRQSILQNTGAFTGSTDAWIGLDDYDNDEIFVWHDGVPSSSSNTAWDTIRGEPDDNDDTVCGRIRDGETLIHDKECDNTYGRLCEYCPE